METKYSFRMKSDARGVVKIKTTHPHGCSYVRPYLLSTSKERLPEDVSFRVVKGKRWTDIVVYYESEGRNFYSQRFIDLLNRFVDMSRFSYPIKIENTDLTYYAIYNLPECTFLNRKASFLKPGTTPCFDLHEKILFFHYEKDIDHCNYYLNFLNLCTEILYLQYHIYF